MGGKEMDVMGLERCCGRPTSSKGWASNTEC